jgi:hypothetical protein
MPCGSLEAQTQPPQIPTLQVCNVPTVLQGSATVSIVARGTFTVQVSSPLECDPNTLYPMGSLSISGISMSDSVIEGTCVSTLVERLTSTGWVTPTAYLSGRCSLVNSAGQMIQGYHYWMMIANNNGASTAPETPEVISFLIFNNKGVRVAYGTGPVVTGHIDVKPTAN